MDSSQRAVIPLLSGIFNLYNTLDRACKTNPKLVFISSLALGALGVGSMLSGYTIVPIISFSTASWFTLKTAYTWKHVADHILYDALNLPYIPSLNHKALTKTSVAFASIHANQKVPILQIAKGCNTPYARGLKQGYVLGPAIFEFK